MDFLGGRIDPGSGPEDLPLTERVLYHIVDFSDNLPSTQGYGVLEAHVAAELSDELRVDPPKPGRTIGEYRASLDEHALDRIRQAVTELRERLLVEVYDDPERGWLITPTRPGQQLVREWQRHWIDRGRSKATKAGFEQQDSVIMGTGQKSEGAPTLTELQQTCLQKIFDHFNRTGNWPRYRDILRQLVLEVGSIDLQAVLNSIPISPQWSGYLSSDQELVLTVDRLLLCRGAEPVLADFARAVGYAAGRYLESDEGSVVITNEDLQRHLGLEEVAARRVERLLLIGHRLMSSASGPGPDGTWSMTLSDDIHWFRNVRTIDDYLAARGEMIAAGQSSPVLPTHVAKPAPKALYPTGIVTFLFTDIEGSTRLWEHQPDLMPVALSRHNAIIREIIEAHGGVVFKTVGDAFCAAFAGPFDALTAAIDVQRALLGEPWDPRCVIRVRMALHTGAAEEENNDYQGQPVNQVARLLSAGHGGQTLVSLATHQLVRGRLPPDTELRDLGEYHLRDLKHTERIFQVVAPELPTDFPPIKGVNDGVSDLALVDPRPAGGGRTAESRYSEIQRAVLLAAGDIDEKATGALIRAAAIAPSLEEQGFNPEHVGRALRDLAGANVLKERPFMGAESGFTMTPHGRDEYRAERGRQH